MSDPVCDDLSALLKRIDRLTQERDEARRETSDADAQAMLALSTVRAERDRFAVALDGVRASIVESIGLARAEGGAHLAAEGWLGGLLATLPEVTADLVAAHDARVLRSLVAHLEATYAAKVTMTADDVIDICRDEAERNGDMQ